MEIVLIQSVKGLGKIGDVVDVKNGYARNYLVPNKKALRATEANIAYFESAKDDIKKQNGDLIEKAEAVASKISGKSVLIIEQAGDDGKLYGSVSAQVIADAISKQYKEVVDRTQVALQSPIKFLGSYDVELELHAEVSTSIKLDVARNAEEVAAEKDEEAA